jgi:peptidoglycan/LPS O-acetylase OafA/YrhL
MTASKKRIGSIDTLRGLGAISIIVFHLLFIADLKLPDGFLKSFATMGGAAVPLFFAISAYSMAYAYDQQLSAQDGVRQYFTRRYLRIAPLFYFMLIINMFIGWLMSDSSYKLLDVFLSLSFLFPFIPGKHQSLVMAGWAIGIQWVFYAVFPLLLLLTSNLLRSFIFLIIALLISIWMDDLGTLFPGVPDSYFYMNFANHLVFFASGFFAYQLRFFLQKFLKKATHGTTTISSLLFMIGWLLLILYFYLHFRFPFDIVMVLTWSVWLTGASLGFSKLINNRLLQHIGKVSYSTYLTHPVVIVGLLKSGLYTFLYNHNESHSFAFILSCTVTIVLVIAISNVTYFSLEIAAERIAAPILGTQRHVSR